MALKRVPSDLSFAKMREKHAPKADLRTARRDGFEEPPATSEAPDQEMAAARVSESPVVTAVGGPGSTSAVPVKEPDSYPAGAQVIADEPPRDAVGGQLREALGTSGDCGTEEAASIQVEAPSQATAAGKIKMNVRVPVPADGVSEIFDRARGIYGTRVAFKAILDKALTGYEAALLEGEIAGPLPSYPTAKSGVQTSRTMASDAYAVAKAKLDPLDILGPSTFGAAVLKNALSWYFSRGA